MATNTGISWTHWPGFRGATWNPTVGCTRVSPGCAHCYAERWAWRMLQMARGAGRTSHYEGTVHLVGGEPRWTGQVNLAPEHIVRRPLRTKAPTCYFVDSESDLFHDGVAPDVRARLWDIMRQCPQHRFLILTKRPDVMRDWLVAAWGTTTEPPDGFHIYLGISAEDQPRLDERAPHLLALAERGWSTFISYEPALGPLDLKAALRPLQGWGCCWCFGRGVNPATGEPCPSCAKGVLWVICGAESGSERRPFEVAWAQSAREQCEAARVAFYTKQGSAHKPGQQADIPDGLWSCKEFPEVRS